VTATVPVDRAMQQAAVKAATAPRVPLPLIRGLNQGTTMPVVLMPLVKIPDAIVVATAGMAVVAEARPTTPRTSTEAYCQAMRRNLTPSNTQAVSKMESQAWLRLEAAQVATVAARLLWRGRSMQTLLLLLLLSIPKLRVAKTVIALPMRVAQEAGAEVLLLTRRRPAKGWVSSGSCRHVTWWRPSKVEPFRHRIITPRTLSPRCTLLRSTRVGRVVSLASSARVAAYHGRKHSYRAGACAGGVQPVLSPAGSVIQPALFLKYVETLARVASHAAASQASGRHHAKSRMMCARAYVATCGRRCVAQRLMI